MDRTGISIKVYFVKKNREFAVYGKIIMMKGMDDMFKKIGTRMYVVILPIVILSLLGVVLLNYSQAKKALNSQIEETMQIALNSDISQIVADIDTVTTITQDIADSFASTHNKVSDINDYNEFLAEKVEESDLITAIGIFTEPGTMDNSNDLINTYVYKDDSGISNMVVEDFKYTDIYWYTDAKSGKQPIYLPAYKDEVLGVVMMSIVVPVYDNNGNFYGAINTDVQMTAVSDMISQFTVGETGKAMLIAGTGTYLTNDDSDKIISIQIAEDEGSGFESAASSSDYETKGAEILATGSGVTSLNTADGNYDFYYQKIDKLDWILGIKVSADEVNAPVRTLLTSSMTVIIIFVLICCAVIFVQIRYITKNINKVSGFASQIATGDFTVEPLINSSKDEIGQMTDALNTMLVDNKNIISSISEGSDVVGTNCEKLKVAVDNLIDGFNNIEDSIKNISEKMIDNSATTQELTASVEDVNSSVNLLAEKSKDGDELVKDIKARATGIEKDSNESFKQAMDLSSQYEKRLKTSIEDSAVVNEIGVMAEAISDIASQINLLSLNASIEAARAGEHGKGFAVVANEIGSLAGQTADTVAHIKDLVEKVQSAVNNLSKDSSEILNFIGTKVTPDYNEFVNTAKQYGKDAESMGEIVEYLNKMTQEIERTTGQVSQAIQLIAESSSHAADESSNIINNVEEVSEHAKNVDRTAKEQKAVSEELNGMIHKFKLE